MACTKLKKEIIKKCIEPYLFMSRLTLVLLSILVTNIKKYGEGDGGICKIDRVAAFVSNAALTSYYGSN